MTDFEHRFNTCRYCHHFQNGRCNNLPIHQETTIQDAFQYHIENGELSEFVNEYLPTNIKTILDNLVPDLPKKWRKAINDALDDSYAYDLYPITDAIETWIMSTAKSIDNGEIVNNYIDDPNDWSCSYFM